MAAMTKMRKMFGNKRTIQMQKEKRNVVYEIRNRIIFSATLRLSSIHVLSLYVRFTKNAAFQIHVSCEIC